MKTRIGMLVFIFLMFATMAWPDQQTTHIGIVDAIDGPSECVAIVHGTESISNIKPGFPLFAGDKVMVKESGTKVRISVAGQKEPLVIRKENAAELGVIKDTSQVPTVIGNMIGWLAQAMPGHKEEIPTVSAATRGGPPPVELSALKSGKATVLAGKRNWIVSWKNGKAPYSLTLTQEKDHKLITIIDRKDIKEKETTFNNLNLETGQYRLTLNSNESAASAILNIVTEKDLPDKPQAFHEINLPNDLKNILYIAWLYGQDNGKLAFEAMQEAFAAAASYEPAAQLLQAMKRVGTGSR